MKFYFRAQDINVSLPGLDVDGKLILVWKRGPRRTQTEPFEVKEKLSTVDGSLSRTASTSQDLALICTMFKNPKTGAFESKMSSFSLREEQGNGEEVKLGTATIDLSSYASPDKSTDRVELSFLDGKVRLQLTLSSHWLKSMSTDDDNDSMSSFGSLQSSLPGGKSEEDEREDLDVSNWQTASACDPAGNPFANSVGIQPPPQTEREMADAMRNAAIEARWNEEAERVERADELETTRAELTECRAQYALSQKELKSQRTRADRLAAENRVLRREQRGGKRDEVILQLESELVFKEQERADMEENLSKAFSGVLDDAHARITTLTAERDRLLMAVEGAAGKKGFHRK